MDTQIRRSCAFLRSIVLLSLLCLPPLALAAIGRTVTLFDVDASGASNYSIPLFVPPATGGMAPQLALTYNSGNTSALLGVGWSISGLSSITRCSSTFVQDGTPRDVRNDLLDRFCLNGNRLRSNSGTYGSTGATYRTEIETFSRVTSYGEVGNGPEYFVEQRKDGLTYEYGGTEDSRIQSLGQSSVRTWALNKISDRAGNSILLTYIEDGTNGSYRIQFIRYAANPAQGLVTAYQVAFEWQTKPTNEIDSGYVAGSRVKEVTRLDRIDITHDATLVRRYELTYEGALSSTSRSRLASVQECAGASLDCLPATTFAYQNGTVGFAAEASSGASLPATAWRARLLDVTGDGRDDFVYSSSETSGAGAWMVAIANSSGGYGAAVNTGIPNNNFEGAIRIDYNADGREDLLVPYSGGTWWVLTGTTAGLSGPVNTNVAVPVNGGSEVTARAMDVNGDGLEDLVWLDSYGFAGGDTIRYRLRELSGTFSAAATTLVGPVPAETSIQSPFGPVGQKNRFGVPDFNGDGRGDVLYELVQREWDPEFHRYIVDYSWYVECPGGGLSFGIWMGVSSPVRFGDFNGDGKTDLLQQSGSNFSIRFSTGTSFVTVAAPSLTGYGGERVTLDWDSDGYDDVLLPHTASSTWYLMRSTGEGFQAAVPTGIPLGLQGSTAIGDVNGDGMTDIAYNSGGMLMFRARAGAYPDLLQTATDGHGNSTTFTYAPLSSANYTKYADATYPEQDIQEALYVVNSYSASDGIGGSYLKSFWYYGARVDLQGRGFEGFHIRRATDSRDSPLRQYTYFNQRFPYTGTPEQEMVYQQSMPVWHTTRTWNRHTYGSDFESGFLPYEVQASTSLYEYGGTHHGQLVRTIVRQNSVDRDTGAVYDVGTTTTEAATANGVQPGAVYMERVYTPVASLLNDQTTWCVGRPNQIQLINSHNRYGGTESTRTTNISWDPAACRPTQIIIEPGSGQLQVTRALDYDAFGNVNSDTVTGVGMTNRRTQANWGSDGQFPVSVTNALSQVTNLGWDYKHGLPASETDPNGILRSWQYDVLGRRTREDRADGTATTWSYGDCSVSGCANANNKMVVTETQLAAGGAVVTDGRLYTDLFDRPIASSTRALSGAYNRIERQYDALGRVYREGAPCWWAGCTQFWTTLSYDLLNRVTQVSRPVSDSDSTQQVVYSYYEGLTSRTVDALNKQSTKTANAVGGMARSTDHDGYYQSFDYDAFGNAVRVTDSVGDTLQSNTFNSRGMRTAQTDMVAGAWTYVPNALGEVVEQRDAKNQQTLFEYDELGRLKKRTEPEGITTWNWGGVAASHNIGRLASVVGPGYTEGYGYDGVGRLLSRTITSDATYGIDYEYNAIGALHALTYPTSTSGYRLKLQYDYQNGLLLRVKDSNAPATVFWTGNDMDASGHVVSETLGNGVQTIRGFDGVTGQLDYIQSGAGGAIQNLNYAWDRVGNLTQRQDVRQGLTENFYYDNLHRLTSSTGPDPTTASYDFRGNALTRTGNIGSGYSNTVTWYSYNLPNTITAASNNSSQFFYAPDRSRWKQLASYAGTSETTIYVGGLIEKVTLGGVTSWKHAIAGGSGTVATYTRKSDGTNAIHYLTRDHLGSVDSVSNAAGAIEVRLSFGAFGQRRREAGWSGQPTVGDWTQITNTTRRGFTEHEMLDNLNLTHMNGRVYDQVVGKFLSADPFVQAPGFTQSFNRYSYTFGNPLTFTDPSGYASTWDHWQPQNGGRRSGYGGGTGFRGACTCRYEEPPDTPPNARTIGGGGRIVPVDPIPGTHAAGARDAVNSTVDGTAGTLVLPRLAVGSLRLLTLTAAELSAIVTAPILLFVPNSNPRGANSARYTPEELRALMAAAGGSSGGANIGGATTPGDPNQFDPNEPPRLSRIHSPETIRSGNSSSYNYWRQRSTDEIVRSLRVGAEEPLIVRPDGRIFQGNTRTLILEERGFDINTLPREILP